MKNNSINIIFIIITLTSCNVIRIGEYFSVKENEIQKYNSTWVIGTEKKLLKKPNTKLLGDMPPQMPSDYNDTIRNVFNLIYKSTYTNNLKIVYAIDVKDTLKANPSIGHNHFLFSVMVFRGDTTYLAPIYKLDEIQNLKFSDFKSYIPPSISKKDSILIRDGIKTTILYDFKIQPIKIDNVTYNKCLKLSFCEDLPEVVYFGEVWMSKKFGILKWIRTTGRTEVRKFNP